MKTIRKYSWSLVFVLCAVSARVSAEGPPVQIDNLKDQSSLETGWVVGNAKQATEVGIQFDSGPIQKLSPDADGKWRVATPNGANTWANESKHAITVGIFSEGALLDGTKTTLKIIKHKNHDIDGNGYPDFVLATGRPDSANVAFVYLTQKGKNLPAAPSIFFADGLESRADFYYNTALDDINGDGFADLVIARRGAAFIYQSESKPLSLETRPLVLKSPDDPAFGDTLSLEDLNGDGYSDLFMLALVKNPAAYIYISAGGAGFENVKPEVVETPYAYPDEGGLAQFTFGANIWLRPGLLAVSANRDMRLYKLTPKAPFLAEFKDVKFSGQFMNMAFLGNSSEGVVTLVAKTTAKRLSQGDGFFPAEIVVDDELSVVQVDTKSGNVIGKPTPVIRPQADWNWDDGRVYSIATGDTNGDGVLDLILSTAKREGDSTRLIFAYQSHPGKTLASVSPVVIEPSQYQVEDLLLRDINGDGCADLVTYSRGGVGRVFLSQGYTGLSEKTGGIPMKLPTFVVNFETD
jgi:hypothetical protein